MFASKFKRSASILTAAAATALSVGIALAPAANAAVGDTPQACAVSGSVTVNTPSPTTFTNDTFNFTGVTIICAGLPTSPLFGTYVGVSASGNAWGLAGLGEDCLEGEGEGHFTGGSNGTATITGGEFSFVRAAVGVEVQGSIIGTIAGVSHDIVFDAALAFVPTAGGCFPAGSGTTTADLIGAAVLTGNS